MSQPLTSLDWMQRAKAALLAGAQALRAQTVSVSDPATRAELESAADYMVTIAGQCPRATDLLAALIDAAERGGWERAYDIIAQAHKVIAETRP